MPEPRTAFLLALVDARPGDEAAGPLNVRLRRALKCLLRSFNLRCVRVESGPVPPQGRLAEAFGVIAPPDAPERP